MNEKKSNAHEQEKDNQKLHQMKKGSQETQKEAQKKEIDWENIAKYKAAELENYIKRQKDAVSNAYNDGRTSVITNVLPVLDNIDEALKTIKDENDRKGIEILQRKFIGILTGMGVEEIPVSEGDHFDPYIHQCVTASENSENKVIEIWQKGYKFSGRVIRPVTVKI